ncbi:hypothetical protein ACE939_13775 [Aquimarina sp. W85]|uniref:hypothetical protein n=1 Tax=Aquimarina rhodophyticola TaxID=3342246 RepID=UPI00366AB3E2
MNSAQIKQNLYSQCRDYTAMKLKRLSDQVYDIQSALESETKSSAGDKHETGRAMLHLEREKLGIQIAEAQKLDVILSKIDITPSTLITLGSLVYTSGAAFFMSISIGSLEVHDTTYYAVGVNSPIGKMLLGKKIGDIIQFNGNPIVIENII